MRDSSHGGELAPARRRLSWTMTLMLVIGGLVASTALVSAGGTTPGNNGTIKIDDHRTGDDTHPNNEPHVGCSFDVDFYGFDADEGEVELDFYAWPPTGDKQLIKHDTTVLMANDTPGGSEAGYDGSSRDYNGAEFAVGTPHPQQGYHVKLVVTSSEGRKQKVFWVEPCGYPYP